jgi:O-antigen/teichoic acid export membrane protein
MTCTLVVLGRSILTVWVGPVYGDYDYLVTTLAIAALAVTSEGPAAAVLKGMARHRPLAISAICSGLANLGLSIVLIHPFGLEGVALGTLGPTLAESLGFVLPYTLWVVRVPLSLFAREVVVPAFLPAALMLATLYAGRSLVRPDSLLALAALIALGCGAFLAAYLSLSATAVERQLWRSLASGTLRLASPLLKR